MSFPTPTSKQARIIWLAITTFGVAFLLAFLAACVWGLGWLMNLLSPVLWPLAIGGILAYLLDPVVDFFVRHRVPRSGAIILVFALFVVGISIFLASVVPQLVRETGRLIDEVPRYSQRMQGQFNTWVSQQPFLDTWRAKLLGSPTNRTTLTTNTPPSTNEVATATAPGLERAW